LLTPDSPERCGSYAETWVPWFESELEIQLREWQHLVLDKALSYDRTGRLLYRDVIVSTPRQQGKSILLLALAVMRAQHAELFGEPQEIIHVANALMAARRIIRRAWRWAEVQGYKTYRAEGREAIEWTDGSRWQVSSAVSIWGATASLALTDEGWAVDQGLVTDALLPVMVERNQPQIWLLSTANAGTTDLMPTYRKRATDGAPRTFIAEWSAPPGADYDDPEVWRAASPHWTPAREELIEASRTAKGFAEQWLNRWPALPNDGLGAEWPPGWSDCPRIPDGPPSGLVGAVEASLDRSRYGVAVARQVGSVLQVWAATFGSVDQAQAQLRFWGAGLVIQGASLQLPPGPWQTEQAGMRETRQATPALADLVRRGLLAHNHDHDVGLEAATAQIARSESGQVLSAHRSTGTVCGLKAAMWAAWAVSSGTYAIAKPAIW